MGQEYFDYGVQTTPLCHFCVRESNLRPDVVCRARPPSRVERLSQWCHLNALPLQALLDLVPQYEAQMITSFLRVLTGTEQQQVCVHS